MRDENTKDRLIKEWFEKLLELSRPAIEECFYHIAVHGTISDEEINLITEKHLRKDNA
jgi:hypothetical protein